MEDLYNSEESKKLVEQGYAMMERNMSARFWRFYSRNRKWTFPAFKELMTMWHVLGLALVRKQRKLAKKAGG